MGVSTREQRHAVEHSDVAIMGERRSGSIFWKLFENSPAARPNLLLVELIYLLNGVFGDGGGYLEQVFAYLETK
jgi:hypothetical protein